MTSNTDRDAAGKLREARELVAKWRDWNSTAMTPITCADVGFAVSSTPCFIEMACTNCENEQKKVRP